MRLQLLTTCLLAIVAAIPAKAQSSFAPAVSSVAEPTAPATTRRVSPSVQALLTSKDKVATGSIGTTISRDNGGELNPWLSGSGPLDESDATAPVILADLSGLRSAPKVATGINYLHWDWTEGTQAMLAFCRRVFSDSATAPDSLKKLLATAAGASSPIERARLRDSVVTQFSRTQCGSENVPPSLRSDFLKLADFGIIWLVGASGEYGRPTFKYADTLNAAYTKRVADVYAASVGGGVYLPDPRLLLAATLRYERSFKEGASRQYCVPVGTTNATQCRSVPLTPPEGRKAALLTLEGRRFVNEHYGLSPRLTINTSAAKDVGVEFPILLRQDADAGFKTAFSLGWKSRPSSPDVNDRLYVSLALGAAYGIDLNLKH
jgi:hypothetical protein